MSAASEQILGTNDEAEASVPAAEPSRPSDPRRRPPPRESLATLDEEDFDFHDTIPAPPWLDDAPDSSKDPFTPPR